MTECEVCETVNSTERYCTVYREGNEFSDITRLYRWHCTCPKGRKSVRARARVGRPTFDNIEFMSEMFLNDGEIYCEHLLKLFVLYEVKRSPNYSPTSGIKHVCRGLAFQRTIDLVRNIYDNNKNNFEEIETIFKTNKGLEYRPYRCLSRIEFKGSSNEQYTVKYQDKEWSCTCKGFYYHKHCKHIKTVKAKEQAMQNRRDLGISLAILFNNNK